MRLMLRALPAATVATGVATLAGVAGCASGLHSSTPPQQVYVLRATPMPRSDLQHNAASSLYVGRPIPGPGLDSERILLVQNDHRMGYFAGGRWPSALPAVVESLTVDTLRATGDWSTVQNSASTFAADYLLQITIRRFEADYSADGAAPDVHVVLDCIVGRRAGREVISSFIAEGSATASANRLGDVVSAFEDASNKALSAIAERSRQSVQGASEHPPQTQNVESPVPSMTR